MTDPHDLDDTDLPGARHLARTLHAVAAATPVPDRRAALEARLPSAGASPVGASPLADGRSGRRRTVAALAVAAVVLVVVALAAVAIRRGDDGAVDLRPVEDPGTGTGWYLPGDGWTVTAAVAEERREGRGSCPCTTLAASETGDDPAALFVTELPARTAIEDEGTEPIDVGGRPGVVVPPEEVPEGFEDIMREDSVDHIVHVGGRRLAALSKGVDSEAVVALLDAWADRIDAGEPVRREDLPLPDGMEAARPRTTTWEYRHQVLVTATEDATGATLHYQLTPTGLDLTYEALLDSERTTFDGEEFTVATHRGPDDQLSLTRFGGPVDVATGTLLLGATASDPDVIAALEASLHEVDTATWRSALDAITPAVDERLLTARTLLSPPLTGP